MYIYKMKLVYTISQIAILTGHNKFQTQRDYLIQFWKKTHKDDFLKYQELAQFEIKTDKTVFDNISKKNNLNLQNDLYKCFNSKNVKDLDKAKENLLKKVDKLDAKEKKEITESIKNLSNTKFGIKNEEPITKILEHKMKCVIKKDDLFIKKTIIDDTENGFTIQMGGKIDGIRSTDGAIIEVKNRMKKLFLELRDYEKVQLMCYLYLWDAPKGFLVEALKGTEKTELNIIECDFDEEFMNNIIQVLGRFSIYYAQFIQNHDLKLECMQNENFELDF